MNDDDARADHLTILALETEVLALRAVLDLYRGAVRASPPWVGKPNPKDVNFAALQRAWRLDRAILGESHEAGSE